jgi:[ribosomal protein S5]-alanine N-acetyltransferase
MEIFFEGITLRPWTMDDAKVLAEIANNRNIADQLQDLFPFPYSKKDARKWLKTTLLIVPPRNFAIIADNKVAGNIGIIPKEDIHRINAEIGYFLSEKYWGRGIACRAVKALTSYAFSNFDIVRVYAETFSDNLRSRRTLEKAGFILEANLKSNIIKNGIVKDSCIYSILKDDFKYFLTTG